jgi:hypothetical protein
VFLVRLYILTKFHLAMGVVIEFAVVDNFRWTLCFRNTTFQREHVAPKYSIVHHLNDKHGWKMLEWKHGVISTDTLFDCAVVSFDFGNVLVT